MLINDYIKGLVPADSEIRELCKPATGNGAKEPEKTTKKDTKTTVKNTKKQEEKTMKKNSVESELATVMAEKRALEERLARLEKLLAGNEQPAKVEDKSETETVSIPGATVRYFENDEGKKRIALVFDKKPSDEVRALLKDNWWRYHGKSKTWERNDKKSARESIEIIAKAIKAA